MGGGLASEDAGRGTRPPTGVDGALEVDVLCGMALKARPSGDGCEVVDGVETERGERPDPFFL